MPGSVPGTWQPLRLRGVGQIPQTQAIGEWCSFGLVTLCLSMEPSKVTRILVSVPKTPVSLVSQGVRWWEDFLFPTDIAHVPGVEVLVHAVFLSHFPGQEKEKNNHLPSLPPTKQAPPSLPFEPGGRKPSLPHETPS